MREMYNYTRQQNLTIGIFYNGTAADLSDAQWMAHAQRNFETVEGTLGIIPDQAIFASWNSFPTHNLPETSPRARTWLINRHFRERMVLDVYWSGRGAKGQLRTRSGVRPIANATINAYVPGVDFSKPLPWRVVSNVVPPNAQSAFAGYRLNAECNCQGLNDVPIGPIQYQETRGGNKSFSYLVPPVSQRSGNTIIDGEWMGGTRVTRIIADIGASFLPNSDAFPVTPGADFDFIVPSSTIGGLGWFGHVFLIWFDGNGNVISAVTIVPEQGRMTAATVTTDAVGRFVIPKMPRKGQGPAPVTVEFGGNDTHAPVAGSPLR